MEKIINNYLSFLLIQIYYNKDLSEEEKIEMSKIVDDIIK